MRYINAIMLFCYVFVLGAAVSTLGHLPNSFYLALYLCAGLFFVVAITVLLLVDVFEIFEIPGWVLFVLLGLSAFSLGAGRYTHNTIVRPFIDNPAYPNHILHFTDSSRSDQTTIIGQIVAEPENRFMPYERTELMIKPEIVDPEPGSGKEYRVGEGFIKVIISPDLGPVYEELSSPEAYGYRVQVRGSLLRFNPTTVPYSLDLRRFWENQNVYAQMRFYRISTPEDPEIRVVLDPKTGEPYRGGPVAEFALTIKKKILYVIKQTLPYPYSAFLAGVTIGARRGLEPAYCVFEQDKKSYLKTKYDLITEEFRWSGTSHVLAVSGLHVTIITIMLYAIFAVFRVPKKFSAPLIVFALIIFTIITGGRPSTVRATIMNSLIVMTEAYLGLGLKTSLLFGIGVAAFSQLFRNPKLLFEPAFTLSFMAVLSLGLITGPAERLLKLKFGKRLLGGIIGTYSGMIGGALLYKLGLALGVAFSLASAIMILTFAGLALGIWVGPFLVRFIPRWLMQFISAQFAIQFGMMLPLSAFYFNHLPVAGPIANVVAIPLIGIIVQLGIIAGLISMIIPVVGSYIALMMNATNYLFIWLFMFVVHWSTETMPYPYMKSFTPKWLTFYYLGLGFLLFLDKKSSDIQVWYYRKRAEHTPFLKQKICGALAGAGIILVLLPAWFWKEPYQKHSGKLQVNFLDVGFSSAIHIQTPRGKNFMINGGSFLKFDRSGGFDVADFRIVPYLLQQRIGILDGVFIGSVEPVDISGISTLVNVFIVDKLYTFVDCEGIKLKQRRDSFAKEFYERLGDRYSAQNVSKSWIRDRAVYYREILFAADAPWFPFKWFDRLAMSPLRFGAELTGLENKKPELFPVSRGDLIYEEEYDGVPLKMYILNPDPGKSSQKAEDKSLVIKLEYGSTGFLFTNGIGKAAQAKLFGLGKNIQSTVLQVPQHGHKKSLAVPFVEKTGAKMAVLEFGYPRHLRGRQRTQAVEDADYIDRIFSSKNISLFRTDKVGTVMFVSDGQTISEPETFKGKLSSESEDEDLRGVESLKEF